MKSGMERNGDSRGGSRGRCFKPTIWGVCACSQCRKRKVRISSKVLEALGRDLGALVQGWYPELDLRKTAVSLASGLAHIHSTKASWSSSSAAVLR